MIDGDKDELDLLTSCRKAIKDQVEKCVKRLQGRFGNKWDFENLKLSGFVVRNALGLNVLSRVIRLAGADATGPGFLNCCL